MAFDTRKHAMAPAWTSRYTVAFDTRSRAATSPTVSRSPEPTCRTTNAPNGVASGGNGANVCDPVAPSTPVLSKGYEAR
jgi:hypothetical protein